MLIILLFIYLIGVMKLTLCNNEYKQYAVNAATKTQCHAVKTVYQLWTVCLQACNICEE